MEKALFTACGIGLVMAVTLPLDADKSGIIKKAIKHKKFDSFFHCKFSGGVQGK